MNTFNTLQNAGTWRGPPRLHIASTLSKWPRPGSNWRKRASASWKKTTKSSTMITPPRISSHNWCVRCEPGVETMIGKRVQFHEETWQQLRLLASESMKTFQELADEAFSDLLRKHGQPASLKEALRRSAGETAKVIPLKGKTRETPKKR